MRITEECINHNAVRLIGEISATLFELNEMDAALALAEIEGIEALAAALKEVLRS